MLGAIYSHITAYFVLRRKCVSLADKTTLTSSSILILGPLRWVSDGIDLPVYQNLVLFSEKDLDVFSLFSII